MRAARAAWVAGYRAGRRELAQGLPIASLAVQCSRRHTHGQRPAFLAGWVEGARYVLVGKRIVRVARSRAGKG